MSNDIPTIKPVALVERSFNALLPWVLVGLGFIGLLVAFVAVTDADENRVAVEESQSSVPLAED